MALKLESSEVSTVTLLCGNAISMEGSQSCRRGTLLATACSILRVSIDDQVNALARRGNKIVYSELHPIRGELCLG